MAEEREKTLRQKNASMTGILAIHRETLVPTLENTMDLVNKKIDYQLVSGKEGSNSSLLTVRKSCGNVIEEAETNLAVAFLEKSNSYNHSNTVSSTCFSFNQPVSTDKSFHETVFCNLCNKSPVSDSFYLMNKDHTLFNNNDYNFMATCDSNQRSLASLIKKVPFQKTVEKTVDVQSEINSIKQLQKLCLPYHLMLPKYQFSNNTCSCKPCDISTKTAVCSLLPQSLQIHGKCQSKKIAQEQAANDMSELIKKTPKKEVDSSSSHVYEYGNNSGSPSNFLLEPTANILDKDAVISLSSIKLIDSFFNQELFEMPFSQINQPKFQMKAVDILNLIAKEEGFSTKYVVFPKNKDDNMVNVLIQLLLIPIFLHVSQEETKTKAMEKAASVALMYLQTVMKKKITHSK